MHVNIASTVSSDEQVRANMCGYDMPLIAIGRTMLVSMHVWNDSVDKVSISKYLQNQY